MSITIIPHRDTIIYIVYKNAAGKFHREDGPAIEYSDGSKFWCLDGVKHRLDGPASIFANGYTQYWINGEWSRDHI